jgi:hypothetical protein
MHLVLVVDLREDAPGCISPHLLHLRQDVLFEATPLSQSIQVILEL